jgi:hypothetical protein
MKLLCALVMATALLASGRALANEHSDQMSAAARCAEFEDTAVEPLFALVVLLALLGAGLVLATDPAEPTKQTAHHLCARCASIEADERGSDLVEVGDDRRRSYGWPRRH